MLNYFEAGRKIFYFSALSIVLFGCSSPNNITSSKQDKYEMENKSYLNFRGTQQERYDHEKTKNENNDLLNKINPDITKSAKSTFEDLEKTISSPFPGNPKIKKSGLVWKFTWEEFASMFK